MELKQRKDGSLSISGTTRDIHALLNLARAGAKAKKAEYADDMVYATSDLPRAMDFRLKQYTALVIELRERY